MPSRSVIGIPFFFFIFQQRILITAKKGPILRQVVHLPRHFRFVRKHVALGMVSYFGLSRSICFRAYFQTSTRQQVLFPIASPLATQHNTHLVHQNMRLTRITKRHITVLDELILVNRLNECPFDLVFYRYFRILRPARERIRPSAYLNNKYKSIYLRVHKACVAKLRLDLRTKKKRRYHNRVSKTPLGFVWVNF